MSIGCICVSLCFVLVIYFLLGIVIKSSYSYFLLGIAIKSSYPYFESATTTFARKIYLALVFIMLTNVGL